MTKPTLKPDRPNFSSGPCAKYPGWAIENLSGAMTGRSHRSGGAKKKLSAIIDLHRSTLGIPDDYKIAIIPGSDSGAVEAALWSLLGPRGVDVLAFEAFSRDWATDITDHLKLPDVRVYDAPYGVMPDTSKISGDRDLVFAWNGTTSGVVVPNADFIDANRAGLTICDATSAVFAYDMPWDKLDVTTWSWQKVIGGEAAHGMIVLSPRAIERLTTYTPAWPIPKIFRMTNKGKLLDALFTGEIINTPSMLAVEDCLGALNWVASIGGWSGTRARCLKNAAALDAWVKQSQTFAYLCHDATVRSITSVCLKIVDPWFTALDKDTQAKIIKDMTALLDTEKAAYDIASYRDAPAGLRIWCGSTVDTDDITRLGPWVDWAYAEIKGKGV